MAVTDRAAAWPRSLSLPEPGLCLGPLTRGQLHPGSSPRSWPGLAVDRCTDRRLVLVVMLQVDLAKSIALYTDRPLFVKLCCDLFFVRSGEIMFNISPFILFKPAYYKIVEMFYMIDKSF